MPLKTPINSIVAIFFILSVASGAGFLLSRISKIDPASVPNEVVVENVVCTVEAKQCPDGSYVSRTGPNCEFAECPSATAQTTDGNTAIDTSDWKTYHGERFEIKYPEDFIDSPKGYDMILFTKKEVFQNPMVVFYGLKPEPRELLIWSISVARETTLEKFCNDAIDSDIGYTKKNSLLNGFIVTRCMNDTSSYKPSTSVAIPIDGNLIILTLYNEHHNEYLSTFDQILSTFKFTK